MQTGVILYGYHKYCYSPKFVRKRGGLPQPFHGFAMTPEERFCVLAMTLIGQRKKGNEGEIYEVIKKLQGGGYSISKQ